MSAGRKTVCEIGIICVNLRFRSSLKKDRKRFDITPEIVYEKWIIVDKAK